MTRTMSEAFDEWMRQYIDEPDRFLHEVTVTTQFLEDENHGRKPSYGEMCARLLSGLMADES